MTVLDLFSGIGGFSLGLGWAGFRTGAFCEADPFCRAVLCGGFPCQDVSAAGPGGGIDGARSGLWREMLRLVGECRPAWVVVENVPALRVRGADRLLGALDALGYAGWPLLVGAAHAGAAHRRQRCFVVAHAPGARLEDGQPGAGGPAPGLPPERRRPGPDRPPAPAGVHGVADGLPARLDGGDGGHRTARLRALGNAVAPPVAAMLGRAIRAADAALPPTAAAWAAAAPRTCR